MTLEKTVEEVIAQALSERVGEVISYSTLESAPSKCGVLVKVDGKEIEVTIFAK